MSVSNYIRRFSPHDTKRERQTNFPLKVRLLIWVFMDRFEIHSVKGLKFHMFCMSYFMLKLLTSKENLKVSWTKLYF